MAEKSKVTRIKATDDTKAVKALSSKADKTAKTTKKADKAIVEPKEGSRNVFVRIGGYFKGAWYELKQVRWPTRKATWSLTLAVILFSAFFVVLILLLDALFQYVFTTIIA